MAVSTFLFTVAGGLLTIGGALDVIVKNQAKSTLSVKLNGTLSRPAPAVNLSSAVLDRVFGQRIWSFRAFSLSVAVALATLICAVLFNLGTSESARTSLVAAAKGQSILGWICLAVVVCLVFVFDFVSYAQTRIFVRATEQSPSATTSSVFLIADIIASFAIFILGFAFARVIAMIIIGHFLFNAPVNTVTAFSPALIEDAAVNDQIDQEITASALYGTDSGSAIIANSLGLTKESALTRLDYFENVVLVRDIGQEAASSGKYEFLDYSAKLTCPTAVDKYSFDDESAYEVLTSSLYIYIYGAQQIPRVNKLASDLGDKYFSRTERVMESGLFRRLATGPRDCPLPVVRIEKSLNLRDALAGVGISDMYMSSIFYTSWEVSRTIPAKFSSYYVIDFVSGYESFLSSSYDVSSRTIFGLSSRDIAKKDIAEFLDSTSAEKSEKVYIPFSSLSMTALFPSFVFLFVSLTRVSLWMFGRCWTTAARVFPALNAQKFIFTIMLGSSALLLAVTGALWIAIDGLWRWAWLL